MEREEEWSLNKYIMINQVDCHKHVRAVWVRKRQECDELCRAGNEVVCRMDVTTSNGNDDDDEK